MDRAALVFLILGLVAAPAWAGKKKPKVDKNAPPPTGWVGQEGWAGQCYHPPDFAAMGVGDRRIAWQATRDEILKQWNGERGDGVQMKDTHVEHFETVLLAKPERIEQVSRDNLEQCKKFMAGGGLDTWSLWMLDTPAKLTEGECPWPPLDYTLFDYLSLANDWQIPANVCKGDHVKIHGTDGDYYRIEPKGPWINVEGDLSQPASGSLPCNIEGCFRGQLIMKFVGESGINQIKPVGIETTFMVPEHGKITVMINDDNLSDNAFKVESGLEHHTGIEYSSAGK